MVVHIVVELDGVLVNRRIEDAVDRDKVRIMPIPGEEYKYIDIRPLALNLIRTIDRMDNTELVFWSSLMTVDEATQTVHAIADPAWVEHFTVLGREHCLVTKNPLMLCERFGDFTYSKDSAVIRGKFPDTQGIVYIDWCVFQFPQNITRHTTKKYIRAWRGFGWYPDGETPEYLLEEMRDLINQLPEIVLDTIDTTVAILPDQVANQVMLVVITCLVLIIMTSMGYSGI